MTRNGSIWMLTAALALSGLATPARAQQVSEARIRELIKQAADPASRLAGAVDAAAGRRRPTTGPVVALTLDDAVKFALERNLDIAVQRLNPEINDIAYRQHQVGLPPGADVDPQRRSRRPTPPTATLTGGSAPARGSPSAVDQLQRRHRAEHSVGRRQRFTVALNNNQADDDQLQHAVQPDLQHELVGHLHAAAAARVQDRLDAPAAAGDQDQPRHLGRAAARDDHQHAVERPQRLLGLRVRRAVGRRRAAVGGPGEPAGEGQPDARRGRHDGADRRRPGAVAGGDAAAEPGDGAGRDAYRGAGAQAAHRRRHAGSELERASSIRPTVRTSAPSRSTSRRPSAARSASGPTSRSRRRTSLANDVTLKYLGDQLRPQADFVATYGLAGLGGIADSSRPGRGVNAHGVDRHRPGRLRRRALVAVRQQLSRAGRCR